MAYDAATRTVVLFGGIDSSFALVAETWTWDGTTWTQQHPATSPPAREAASMAYDAATGTVVLFGGMGGPGSNRLHDTWTWDGTNWTQRHPAISPTGGAGQSMAYDPVTRTVVLFGGVIYGHELRGTWTWDGSTWTKQHPAARPRGRQYASMAYDAATRTVVLFGGISIKSARLFRDTWTWDGTNWAQQHPADSPPARNGAAMAYDAATGTVVLFGGLKPPDVPLGDTWTWDGSNWAQQHPADSPPARNGAVMAYDAATGTVVLFGGQVQVGSLFGDTWTWGSS